MLKSYVFDLDQNILNTKTPIYLLVRQPDTTRKEEAIPNAIYETFIQDQEHARFLDNRDDSMRAFRGEGKLIPDVFDAIQDKAFGPSRDKFMTATIDASPTHIVTARGNPQKEFREMHQKIIYEVLTESQREELVDNMRNHLRERSWNPDTLIDLYLNNNLYIPCSDPEVVKAYRRGKKTASQKKAAGFEKCIIKTKEAYTSYYGKDFMKHRHISIGFSDDTEKNIDAVTKHILEELIIKYPHDSFMLYNTNNPKIIRKESIQHKSPAKPLF